MSTKQASRDAYVYQPLLPSEISGTPACIRLLSFANTSAAYEENKGLEVTLQAYNLNDDLKFNALSYEWGQRGETAVILVDGKSLTIPRSLYLFLKVLRASPDTENILYFADAVCIDQQNLTERASQVQLMGQVYSLARRVHIWLGPERASIGLLFKFCNVLKGSETDIKVRGRFEQIFGEHNEAAFQEAVQAFTTCSYWQRLWVIQEILLAKTLLVHCGKYTVNWNALYEGCQRVLLGEVWKGQSDPSSSFGGAEMIAQAQPEDFDHSRYVSLYLQTMTGGPGELAANPRSNLRATRSKRLYTLKEAVMLHGLAECTDRHDRVYGLLGLVLRGNDRGYFRPDYGEDLGALFQRVMYQCHPDLRIDAIAFCRHLRSVLDLASRLGGEKAESEMNFSRNTSLPALEPLQYSVVVRHAGRLKRQVERLADQTSGHENIPEAKQRPLSTWEVNDSGLVWTTIAQAKTDDLIYSIDGSCSGAIFRRSPTQTVVRVKRKRTTALPPAFIGRAFAHRREFSDFSAIEATLRADRLFASKLVGEKPLLERPGAPWESHVPLSELWELSHDPDGTEIIGQADTLSSTRTTRSDSPARSQKWSGVPGKKRRFDFQWTSEAANSQ